MSATSSITIVGVAAVVAVVVVAAVVVAITTSTSTISTRQHKTYNTNYQQFGSDLLLVGWPITRSCCKKAAKKRISGEI